jgi:hypothetical protein
VVGQQEARMSTRFGPEPSTRLVRERWGWDAHDAAVVAAWLQACAVMIIWLS